MAGKLVIRTVFSTQGYDVTKPGSPNDSQCMDQTYTSRRWTPLGTKSQKTVTTKVSPAFYGAHSTPNRSGGAGKNNPLISQILTKTKIHWFD